MATIENESEMSLAIINNIPSDYHSCDLRNYFSQFIEGKGFDCFHFRHRPETKVSGNGDQFGTSDVPITSEKRTTCCVVRMKADNLRKLMRMYNRKNWLDKNGDAMKQICYISKVRNPKEQDAPVLLTRGEQRLIPPNRETFSELDLQRLPELHPPDLMPQGNVGTPTMTFMDYIKECRLPPSIIKKLGLTFPRVRSSKQYGSVPFDYGGEVSHGMNEEDDLEVYTAAGHEITNELDATSRAKNSTNTCSGGSSQCAVNTEENECVDNTVDEMQGTQPVSVDKTINDRQAEKGRLKGKKKKKGKKQTWKDEESKRRLGLNIEEKFIGQQDKSDGDNDSCEEWERYEALFDDVSNQERNKERLFEEKIELKWEKGGSGLVFYTDAAYWHAQEGDFDEQTADDHDVDMSGYYEDGAGDKDARDFLTIRQEKRRRDGDEATDRFTAGIAQKRKKKVKEDDDASDGQIGKFEAHTRGFGRKIMESQGWKDGHGLGSTITGISDALENEGQKPKDKRGFGYHGEKINRHTAPVRRQVIISTVYDNPDDTDPLEPLKRRHDHYRLKYRDEVKFAKGSTSKDTGD